MTSDQLSKTHYDPLPYDENDFTIVPEKHQRHHEYKLINFLYCVIAVLVIGLLAALWQIFRGPSQLECAKINSPWSPLWDSVDFEEYDFDNDFPHNTLYRGPPTPEREQAWEELWWHRPITVSEQGVSALNKSGLVPAKSKDGTGYTALVEVFHQLHCLNLVRQYTWRHLYSEEDMPLDIVDPVAGRMHVDHCIESLRLSFMCYSDVTPLLILEDPESGLGHRADFNVHHKCRNFDKVVEYVDGPYNVGWTDDGAGADVGEMHRHLHGR